MCVPAWGSIIIWPAVQLGNGTQYKTPDMAARCNSLVRVNVYKDQVNNVGRIPQLPGASKLLAALAPSYWRLNSARTKAKGQPIYATPGSQLDAVQEFLQVCCIPGHLQAACLQAIL